MFWNDPILYGYKDVNIPQVPFMNQMMPNLYNNWVPPFYGLDVNRLPFAPQMHLPFQQIPQVPFAPHMHLPFQQIPQVPFAPHMHLPFQQIPQAPFASHMHLPFQQIPQVPFLRPFDVNLPFFNYYRPFI